MSFRFKSFAFVLVLVFSSLSCSKKVDSPDELPVLSIATWHHNAKAAYSMIFDDFCFDAVHGIYTHAADEAKLRNIPFGFGIVAGSCDKKEWGIARKLLVNGHEPINHSFSHKCAVYGEGWCEDLWGETDINKEIDQARQLITENTGFKPSFFIFPYDTYTPKMIEHLKSAGYLGTRGGQKKHVNTSKFTDTFKLNFDVKAPPESADLQGYSLNQYVDKAIESQGFAFREFHGVNDNSWGMTPLEELQDHFDYLVGKRNSFDVWIANISVVIRYHNAREHCKLMIDQHNESVWFQALPSEAVEFCPLGQPLTILSDKPNLHIVDDRGNTVESINGAYEIKAGVRYDIR